MKKITAHLLLLSFLAPTAEGADILAFSARIQSETLAEEAIDLLHCVADRHELHWELNESQNPYRLRVKEENQKLAGEFHTPEENKTFSLGLGEAQRVCEELAPAAETIDSEPSLPVENWEPEKKTSRWLWIAASVVVLAGGVYWLKSRPDHRAFTMD